MTTIATDGRSMAGDGLCTGGSVIHGTDVRKVHRLPNGSIVGIAGSVYNITAFVEWLAGDRSGEKPKLHDDFEALLLAPDGTVTTWDDQCRSAPQEVPAVTGSGSAIALGAMLAGRFPHEAVAIAAQRDTCTGGTITIEALDAKGDK